MTVENSGTATPNPNEISGSASPAAWFVTGMDEERIEEEPITGKELAERLIKILKESWVNPPRILIVPLYTAAFQIIPVYSIVFGEGMICRLLKQDMRNHAEAVKKTVDAHPDDPKYLEADSFIQAELLHMTRDQMRAKTDCGVRQLLWMKRTLDFIMRFLDYSILVHPDKTTTECATVAYDEVLRPYHGIMLAAVVSTAFRLCPERYELLRRLDFQDLPSAQIILKDVMIYARPLIDELHQTLERHGCNFPDKVGEITAPSLPGWFSPTSWWGAEENSVQEPPSYDVAASAGVDVPHSNPL